VTITTSDMTRFLLSLEQAVDTIFAAVAGGRAGETYIPRVPSAKVTDVAQVLIGERKIETIVTGIRPGEKVHEILVSDEEAHRTYARGDYYVIQPMLPELITDAQQAETLGREYSSADNVMQLPEVANLLREHKLMIDDRFTYEEDMLA
jgi:FlaA1/EpsC-like NDP-sugar epimerase